MDDLAYYSLSFAFSLLLALLFSLRRRGTKNPSPVAALPLPPGPRPIPVLGRFLAVLSFLGRSNFDLEPTLRRLAQRHAEAGVISFTVLSPSRPAIFVSSRTAAHAALVGAGSAFACRPPPAAGSAVFTSGGRNISSSAYGPTWRALRRNLAGGVLATSRLRRFAAARSRALDALVADLRRRAGDTPVMESLQHAMFCLLVDMCFGEGLDAAVIKTIESTQRKLLGSFLTFQVFAIFTSVTKLIFRRRWQTLLSLRRRQEEIFIPLIDARRNIKLQKQKLNGGDKEDDKTVAESAESYVDTLLDVKVPEDGGRPLTDGEMVSLCSEFLSAGTDTTATALQWILANLVKHPEIQAKLHAELQSVGAVKDNDDDGIKEVNEEDLHGLPYLKAVVLEGLRRHPPGHFVLPHAAAVRDATLEGFRIPERSPVNFMVAEMGWDEKVWPEPMKFKPERFLAGGEGEGVDLTGTREIKMMPFGAGRRVCPGMGLALLHLEYFVANLVKEFEWREVDGEGVDLTEKLEFTVVMKRPLQARLVPRRPPAVAAVGREGEYQ